MSNAGNSFQKSSTNQQKIGVQFDSKTAAFYLPTFESESSFVKIISIELEEENDELPVHQKAIQSVAYHQHFYCQSLIQSNFLVANPLAKTNQIYACHTQNYIFFQHFIV